MPIHQRWDADYQTLFVRLEQPSSEREFLTWAQGLLHDESVPSGPRQEFIDLTEVSASIIDSDSLRQLAQAFSKGDVTKESRIAIVASEDVVFGLGRMYQAFRGEETVQLEVFRDAADARAWLGVPENVPGA